MGTFYTSQVKHLPTKWYNAIWRWQYLMRRSIIRRIKMLQKKPKAKLYMHQISDRDIHIWADDIANNLPYGIDSTTNVWEDEETGDVYIANVDQIGDIVTCKGDDYYVPTESYIKNEKISISVYDESGEHYPELSKRIVNILCHKGYAAFSS